MTLKHWIAAALYGISCAVLVTGNVAVRIVYPDKTDMRLLIDYWWLWAGAVIPICVALLLQWWWS